MRDMVRENTPSEINKAIDEDTLEVLEQFQDATPAEIQARLVELDHARDLECYVEMMGAGATLIGVAIAARRPRLWFLPAITSGLVLLHAFNIRVPLTPMLRFFGVWSRGEIEREKFALKLLRGDFERMLSDRSPKSALATAQGEVGLKTGGPMRGEQRRGVRREAKVPAGVPAVSSEPPADGPGSGGLR